MTDPRFSVPAQVPAGARCEAHSAEEAAFICARCGGFACRQCQGAIERGGHCIRCTQTIAPLADPARRLAAQLVDWLIATLPCMLLLYGCTTSSGWLTWLVALLGAAASLAVIIVNLRWMRERGQSIGKRLCKLRVVYSDGRRMPLSRMVWLRNLLPFVISLAPVVGALFAALDMAFIFRSDRRTLHDLMADSIVVAVRR